MFGPPPCKRNIKVIRTEKEKSFYSPKKPKISWWKCIETSRKHYKNCLKNYQTPVLQKSCHHKKHKVLLKSVTKHLLKLNPLCDAGDIKVHNATLLLGSAIAWPLLFSESSRKAHHKWMWTEYISEWVPWHLIRVSYHLFKAFTSLAEVRCSSPHLGRYKEPFWQNKIAGKFF